MQNVSLVKRSCVNVTPFPCELGLVDQLLKITFCFLYILGKIKEKEE